MALKIYPNYEEALNNMGIVKQKNRKDYKGAIEDFTKAIKVNPKNPKSYYNRGKAKKEAKDYNGAIEDFTTAIKLKPQYKNAYMQRSETYSLMGNKAKANSDMQVANSLK
jgi:tetratricopeptide (TPR) repeat protein